MRKHLFIQRPRRILFLVICFTGLLLFSLSGSVGATAAVQGPVSPAKGGLTTERLNVPFTMGASGVQTVNTYSDRVQIKVRGIGQASGAQWSDAFYIFTDFDGNPVEPFRYNEYYNFTLWLNGGPIDRFMDDIPPYNPDHVYVFQINVLTGPLTFAVGDTYTIDNSGTYEITVKDLPH